MTNTYILGLRQYFDNTNPDFQQRSLKVLLSAQCKLFLSSKNLSGVAYEEYGVLRKALLFLGVFMALKKLVSNCFAYCRVEALAKKLANYLVVQEVSGVVSCMFEWRSIFEECTNQLR